MDNHNEQFSTEPLTKRELEVLEMMSAGLSNRDIADKLVISLGTARWYTKQIYGKLGVHGRTEAVIHARERGLFSSPPIESSIPAKKITLTAPRHNLPLQSTPLIGREREVKAVRNLLHESRCVTLTGPAGVGKTRLALQVAASLVDDYENGVMFVDLTSVSDPQLVAAEIADTLRIREISDKSAQEILIDFLRNWHILLVLDNFEQVIASVSVIGELLAAVPRLSLIVTSREVLHIYGENEYMVLPLSVPEGEQNSDPDVLSQYEAVSLFVQRARAVRHDFEITTENAATIAEICVRLDGLPLAIELAAARIQVFTPQMLLTRLENRLRTLVAHMHGMPERQQTLRSAIDWSYDLLSEAEQTLFARLGVFVGGRSLEAIEMICGDELSMDVVDGLESLLNKSLVRQKENYPGEPRFVMLETIHEYALDQLRDSGEMEVLRRRHAEYFIALLEQASKDFRGASEMIWMQRLEIEHDNLRAALDWTLENDPAAGVRLVGLLWRFWYVQGYHIEGRRWIERAIERMDSAPRELYAPLLIGAGNPAITQGDVLASRARLEQALKISRELDDRVNIAWSLVFLGMQTIGEADSYERGMALSEEGLELFRTLNHKKGMAQAYNVLGELARAADDYERAREVYDACLEVCRETGEQVRVAMTLANLSFVLYHDGDYQQAEVYARESVTVCVDIENTLGVATYLSVLAGPLAVNGDPEGAAMILGVSHSYLQKMGIEFQLGDQFEIDRYADHIRRQMGDNAFEIAFNRGQRVTLDEAFDYLFPNAGAESL